MLDIKVIRSNPDAVKLAMKNRNLDADNTIDEILEMDALRRKITGEVEAKKAEQNAKTKQIPVLKQQGQDSAPLMEQLRRLSDEIKALDSTLSELERKQLRILLTLPNIPSEKTPVGKDDSENVEVRRWGNVRDFGFEVKPHWEIGKDLRILDPEAAAKVTGARFHFYRNLGAKLERAVINFYLDTHSRHGYEEVMPPFIVNRSSMVGTGQLPKFEDDAFRLATKVSEEDYFLIPTAEVPVTNLYRGEILDGNLLPIQHCAYSACFRAEAGSAGRDTRGLIRQHQFNKVELVKFVDPAASYDELEKLTGDAERVLQALELPYRVIDLVTGDIGFSSAKTYDIEVWMPSYARYVEISSCSNFEDFQARRAGIRFKYNPKDKAQFVHTLNGSGVAVGRTVAAILENYQNADGSVTVPEVLRPYIGVDVIR